MDDLHIENRSVAETSSPPPQLALESSPTLVVNLAELQLFRDYLASRRAPADPIAELVSEVRGALTRCIRATSVSEEVMGLRSNARGAIPIGRVITVCTRASRGCDQLLDQPALSREDLAFKEMAIALQAKLDQYVVMLRSLSRDGKVPRIDAAQVATHSIALRAELGMLTLNSEALSIGIPDESDQLEG